MLAKPARPFVDDRGRRYSARVLEWPAAARRALGIRPVPTPAVDRNRIWRLMQDGRSVREIARAIGLPKTTVHKLMHEIARDGACAASLEHSAPAPIYTNTEDLAPARKGD
jgi:hypothetical protein